MKQGDFKAFRKHVEKADQNDWIWWQGYYWINLTKKQSTEIFEVLRSKGCTTSVIDSMGRVAHKLPSGITIAEI